MATLDAICVAEGRGGVDGIDVAGTGVALAVQAVNETHNTKYRIRFIPGSIAGKN
jgi:hypothetical protein